MSQFVQVEHVARLRAGACEPFPKKLGSHLLKVLHFVPTAFRCAEYNWIWEALSVRYRTPPLICRTAGKLCKCYAALGLNHRLTGLAHPRHDPSGGRLRCWS